MKTNVNYLLVCTLFCLTFNAFSQVKTLKEAIEQKLIEIQGLGPGGYYEGNGLKLTLKNLSKDQQKILIDAGNIFECADKGAQNMMVVKEMTADLKPQGLFQCIVPAMCVESSDYCPNPADKFTWQKKASGDLLKLVELINAKNYQNSTAQSAVWAITNGHSISEIYGDDVKMARELVTIAATAVQQPIPIEIPIRQHHIVTIRSKMSYQAAKALAGTSLVLLNEQGEILREYMKNYALHAGLHHFEIGINRVAAQGTKYIVRLLDSNKQILMEQTLSENMETSTAEPMALDIAFEYDLEKAISGAKLVVFDANGKSMQEMFSNRNLNYGGHRHAFKFYHTQGENATFVVKLFDNQGNILVEKSYQQPPTNTNNQPTETKVSFTIEYESDKRIAKSDLKIFDEQGNVVAEIFKDNALAFGKNVYSLSFYHKKGKEAKLFARLIAEGVVLKEMQVQ